MSLSAQEAVAMNGTYYVDINPHVRKVGDYTPFYIAIAICSIIFGLIVILNVICCCSRYSDYWMDRHTGNRWIVSMWSDTPHKQPPLDLSELASASQHYVHVSPEPYRRDDVPTSYSQQPLTTSQEYLELHKRESDI